MSISISACVMTFNEEQNIRRCLKSLTWCDEIIVVDSFSTDATVSICKEYTERVHQHEWLGYIGQRNLVKDMATHDWVLFLDADEEVSPALREALSKVFLNLPAGCVGFEFPRQVYYLGKWIRHGTWYPDYKIRLFRKEMGRSGGVEPHDTVHLDGPAIRLRQPLWHYTYRDLSDHVNTMNRFSSISAQTLFDGGRRFRWLDLLFRPSWRFFKGFVIRSGWMDGWRGFVIDTINAFGVGMKYAKLRELEWQARQRED